MLLGILLIWILTALGLWIIALLVPGVRVRGAGGLWLAALVLGLINAFIRPLLWALTLPLTVLTFGLFALVINGFTLWITAQIVPDFEVDGFGPALLGALIMALLGIVGFILVQWLLFDSLHWLMYSTACTGSWGLAG